MPAFIHEGADHSEELPTGDRGGGSGPATRGAPTELTEAEDRRGLEQGLAGDRAALEAGHDLRAVVGPDPRPRVVEGDLALHARFTPGLEGSLRPQARHRARRLGDLCQPRADQGRGPRDGGEARGLLCGELKGPGGELQHDGGRLAGRELQELPGPAQDAQPVMGHPRDLLGADALLLAEDEAGVHAPERAGLVLGLELEPDDLLELEPDGFWGPAGIRGHEERRRGGRRLEERARDVARYRGHGHASVGGVPSPPRVARSAGHGSDRGMGGPEEGEVHVPCVRAGERDGDPAGLGPSSLDLTFQASLEPLSPLTEAQHVADLDRGGVGSTPGIEAPAAPSLDAMGHTFQPGEPAGGRAILGSGCLFLVQRGQGGLEQGDRVWAGAPAAKVRAGAAGGARILPVQLDPDRLSLIITDGRGPPLVHRDGRQVGARDHAPCALADPRRRISPELSQESTRLGLDAGPVRGAEGAGIRGRHLAQCRRRAAPCRALVGRSLPCEDLVRTGQQPGDLVAR